jgi:hypothetical protein
MVSTRACGALSSGSNPDRHTKRAPCYKTETLEIQKCLVVVVVWALLRGITNFREKTLFTIVL